MLVSSYTLSCVVATLQPILHPIGPAEIIWNKTRDACPDTKWVPRFEKFKLCESPDSMPIAWHDPKTERSFLIASTDCTHPAVGPNLSVVSGKHDCSHKPYQAVNDSRPWKYANHQWMQSVRLYPNGTGFVLDVTRGAHCPYFI